MSAKKGLKPGLQTSKSMKKNSLFILLVLMTFGVSSQKVSPTYSTVTDNFSLRNKPQWQSKLSLFKFQDVKLLPGSFKEAEQTDLKYMLSLDADRLLAPYLREAGLPKKAESYTNWENTGLDGHIRRTLSFSPCHDVCCYRR
jgi:hypothetical protein